MTDNKRNSYVTHATEKPSPEGILLVGWESMKVAINEPLMIVHLGEKSDCYFNILGNHLGLAYFQTLQTY